MLISRSVACVLSLVFAATASAQDYPSKTVRIIAAEAGGGADVIARLIAQGLGVSLNQPVIVENIGGAAGAIAINTAAKAAPDGYTILFYANAVWLLPFIQKTPFDPIRDFAPITLAVSTPNVLVVHPSLPVKSVKDLIALAKAKPGDLNYAASGPGSATYLAAALFVSLANIKMVDINYKGAGSALNAVLAGEVPVMFPPASLATPHIKSGKVRGLGVTSATPSALVPGLPPVGENVAGYEQTVKYGVFAPAKTPAAIVNRLNQEIVRFLNRSDVKDKMLNAGAEVVASSTEELAAFMKSDMAKTGKVIKDAGIRVD